ncbi:unnamed protein product [Parajaminaea phylloscopi]
MRVRVLGHATPKAFMMRLREFRSPVARLEIATSCATTDMVLSGEGGTMARYRGLQLAAGDWSGSGTEYAVMLQPVEPTARDNL